MARPELTDREGELLRLLLHARGCDGVRCPTCAKIDLRLADGLPHAGDDPTARFGAVEGALAELVRRLEWLFAMIEGCNLPPGTLRHLHETVEGTNKVLSYLRLPVGKEGKAHGTSRGDGGAVPPTVGVPADRRQAHRGLGAPALAAQVAGGPRISVRRPIVLRVPTS